MKKKNSTSKDVVRFVRKSNNLVESKYKFDIWETRVFTKTLTMIRKDDVDFKEYQIHLSDLVNDFGLHSDKASYTHLRQAAERLSDKKFYVKYMEGKTPRYYKVPIVSKIDAVDPSANNISREQRYVTVQFHPDMKPLLLQLREQFTTYDIRNIQQLPTPYSIRIYELLKQYERIGRRAFEVQELKDILGLDQEYPKYGNFKQRILLKAQRDLEKYTDIKFTFDQVKRGRAVYKLVFHILPNAPKQKPGHRKNAPQTAVIAVVPPSASPPPSEVAEVYARISHLNVHETTFLKWCGQYPLERIAKAVELLLRHLADGRAIANPGGYLYELIKQPALFDATEAKREEAKAKKAQKREQNARRKKLEAELDALKKQHHRDEGTIVQALFLERPDVEERLIEQVKTNPFAKYDLEQSEEANLQRSTVRSSLWLAVKKEFPERFKHREERFRRRKRELEGQIVAL